MNINIKATNTRLTPALQDFIEAKLETIEKFLKPEHKVHVELEVQKHHKSGMVQRAEVTIKPGNLYAESMGNDFYEALDLAVPKIKEQLVKSKGKKLSERRKDRRK